MPALSAYPESSRWKSGLADDASDELVRGVCEIMIGDETYEFFLMCILGVLAFILHALNYDPDRDESCY